MLHIGYLAFYYAHWYDERTKRREFEMSLEFNVFLCREEYHTGILILGPYANPTESAWGRSHWVSCGDRSLMI